jgi:hypothetical protein
MSTPWRRDFLRQISSFGAGCALARSPAAAAGTQVISDAAAGSALPQTPHEQAAAVHSLNPRYEPGDVRRYGADPSGIRDSTQAFIDANAVGDQGGGPVRIPAGRYKYAPSRTMNIAVSWIGEGAHETFILCDTDSFAGEFFRIVGSTEVRDLLFKSARGKAGTGIRLAPADSGQFTGHVRLTRVWMLGFDRNIQCDNNFEVTFDQVRSQGGNEGFYCAPDTAGGQGYCTSHLHLNCYYAENGRNVYYSPSIRYAFRTITFVGGAIEGATGASAQASFTRCAPLKFIQIYLEAAAGIPALVLNDCTVSIEGAYLGGTGGIRIGTNTRIDLQQVIAMSASDIFSGGDGTQQVVMQGCVWPASGNTLAVANIALRNTSINGTTYRDCSSETSSFGAVWSSRESTVVDTNAAQDVYRFIGAAGQVAGGSVSGRFEVIAKDKGDVSNQTIYQCWLGSASGGPKHASLVLQQRLVRGTDVGASEMPLMLGEDGDRGGVKLQFTKNPGTLRVVVDVLFHGLMSAH